MAHALIRSDTNDNQAVYSRAASDLIVAHARTATISLATEPFPELLSLAMQSDHYFIEVL